MYACTTVCDLNQIQLAFSLGTSGQLHCLECNCCRPPQCSYFSTRLASYQDRPSLSKVQIYSLPNLDTLWSILSVLVLFQFLLAWNLNCRTPFDIAFPATAYFLTLSLCQCSHKIWYPSPTIFSLGKRRNHFLSRRRPWMWALILFLRWLPALSGETDGQRPVILVQCWNLSRNVHCREPSLLFSAKFDNRRGGRGAKWFPGSVQG